MTQLFPKHAALIALAMLAAGLTQASQAQTPPLVQPNAQLLAQGIPNIPQSLADKVTAYNDFRGHAFVDWHPRRREMLVSHRKAGANTAQLYRLTNPQGELELLTDGADPVGEASYEPRQGRYIVFERSSGGSEVAQLYRLDGKGAAPVLLTNPDERHNMSAWLHRSAQLVFTSLPLDRTAQGGTRARVMTDIWAMDPEQPEGKRRLAQLDGGGWRVHSVSRDDKKVALTRYISANESELWLLDLASGARRKLLPAAGDSERAVYFAGEFSHDNQQLWVLTDRHSEFRELARLDLRSGKLARVSAEIPWDVSGATLSHDGRLLAARVNADGRGELRLFDALSLKPLPTPPLPAGSIGALHFDKQRGELVMGVSNAQSPSQVFSLAPQKTGWSAPQAWTQAYVPPGIAASRFGEQQLVRWKSFDGLSISGLLSLPPAQFEGKRPVLISIHGGPEAQATVGFLGRNNYYLQELGMAVIQPNVRGSAGYGKRFLALDNGFKREDSVKDIGALLDWIAAQPNLDASRVLVTGGSYGGYMTLAVATHYAERIAGAIDVVGISHFVTFLQNTESYRRDLRRVEYGDERDPAMREFQEKISPLSNAAKIKKPLFVVQGKNDPRVPYTEAEQIVAKVRENGTPVWYLRADNEGHGFARKENQDFQFYSTILFMQQTVLK